MTHRLHLPAFIGVAALLTPAAAQAQTHMGVPAKHLLSMNFFHNGMDVQNASEGTWSSMSATNSDWSWNAHTAPAGNAIVLTELHISAPLVSVNSPVLIRIERWNANWTQLLESIDHTLFIPPNTTYSYKSTWKLDTGMVFSAGSHPRITVYVGDAAVTPSNFEFYASGYYTAY